MREELETVCVKLIFAQPKEYIFNDSGCSNTEQAAIQSCSDATIPYSFENYGGGKDG